MGKSTIWVDVSPIKKTVGFPASYVRLPESVYLDFRVMDRHWAEQKSAAFRKIPVVGGCEGLTEKNISSWDGVTEEDHPR